MFKIRLSILMLKLWLLKIFINKRILFSIFLNRPIRFYLVCFLSLLTLFSPLVADLTSNAREEYSFDFIHYLQSLYGKGYLAEGGSESDVILIDSLELENLKILDFGCGVGGTAFFIADRFAGVKVIGIDLVLSCIENAKKNFPTEHYPNLEFVGYHSLPLSFDDQTFDVVIAKEVFIHIYDKKNVIKEIHRILKSGGLFIVIDWFTNTLIDFGDLSQQIIQQNQLSSFCSFAEEAGFFKVNQTDYSEKYINFLNRTYANNPTDDFKGYKESIDSLRNEVISGQITVNRLQFEKKLE